eukprot:NODE_866_length_1282_cov_4.286294_g637_i0.p1 GENE.NODE_866_length_1282_cov_4.286294_g637_i0~~NODE_866_length_1282_cov_4.286294_g637_i0.p1  ORF type:complete len:92 (-),score=18.28 NODE_866_length_1282_cov_4.286294_g637_i0:3-278(-)
MYTQAWPFIHFSCLSWLSYWLAPPQSRTPPLLISASDFQSPAQATAQVDVLLLANNCSHLLVPTARYHLPPLAATGPFSSVSVGATPSTLR